MQYCEASYRNEDGFTLVAVLGFILLLAMVLTPFALSARISALTSAHAYDVHRLDTSAEAVNNYLAWRLASDIALKSNLNSQRQTRFLCTSGNLRVQITIQPHSSLINLNTADISTLKNGFLAAGLSISDAETLAPQILLYRTPSSVTEQHPDLQVGMKHSPFEDIVELHEWPLLMRVPILTLSRVFSVGSGTSSGERDLTDTANNHFTLQTDISYHSRSVTAVGFFEVSSAQGRSARVGQITAHEPEFPLDTPSNCPGELMTPLLQKLQVALP